MEEKGRIACSAKCAEGSDGLATPHLFDRRQAVALASAFSALLLGHHSLSAAAADLDLAADGLIMFENSKQKYRLQRPTSWEQVEKAGADALFKDPKLKSTDLGVTVTPIRIKRLEQLGDVTAAGERLLNAERKKESTKSVELLQQSSRMGPSGTEFYNFDYTISTTRGDKRILAAVGVANGNLYIVNGSIKCEGPGCKESSPLVESIRKSVTTFDVVV